MKDAVTIYFNLSFRIGLLLILLATLFLFANLTTEFYDTPKFLVLLAVTGIILVMLTLKYTVQNRVVFLRTPLDIPLLLILVVASVSTYFTPSPYVALLGNQARVFPSLAALTTLIIFYFMLTNALRGLREIRFIFYVTLLGGVVLSVISLLSYFGIKYLPFPWTQGQNFTPTGLSFSTGAILALLLPIPLLEILGNKGDRGDRVDLGIRKITNFIGLMTSKIVNSALLTLFGTTIALTGDLASFLGAGLAVILTLVVTHRTNWFSWSNLTNLVFILIPAVVVGLVVALSFIKPFAETQNPFYDLARTYPREIQLDFITSWKASVSAFRDHPFWGTGPSTYLFDFTLYKPIEFNTSKFWNIRFDSAFNEYFHTLATLGGVGLFGLLALAVMFLSQAIRTLTSHFSLPTSNFQLPLAISGLIFFVILAFHTATLPVWIVGLLILASFFVISLTYSLPHQGGSGSTLQQVLYKLGQITTGGRTTVEVIKVEALPGVLLIVSLGVVLFASFFTFKLTLADYHHKLALTAISQNDGLTAYNELVEAEKLNPVSDLYRTDLAQVNFALANAIATAKAPSESQPQGSLTDQDRQNIQVLLQQAINEGRTAVSLSPRSTINWEILGTLYRQISGVAENALIFSLDSYGRAIMQDPLNPNLRLSVGGTYYAIRNYDLAIRFFTDSINLKPDFPNAYYNLSVALRDKGDLNAALQAGEEMLKHIETQSPDYQVASDYLNDLKNRITPPTPPQPPAAETTGALQQEQLPNVVELPQPAEIATPSAIKKPGSTPEPSPTP